MGAGNCILLHLMRSRGLLDHRSIVVIDPVGKTEDDKTYCFWAGDEEAVMGEFAGLVSNSWPQIIIDDEPPQAIAPKRYHRIRSLDLYQSTQRMLQDLGATCLRCHVTDISPPAGEGQDPIVLELADGQKLAADRVFDSRPPRFLPDANNPLHVSLTQSFVGYRVALHAPSEAWQPDAIRMMDFQVPQGPGHEVQFMYVLPEGPSEGLIELTRFGEATLTAEEAAPVLEAYLEAQFGGHDVLAIECGQIPMSTAPMQHTQTETHPRWTPIGTRAGAVKASTGYAFKAMTAHAGAICDGLASDASSTTEVSLKRRAGHWRFRFYDHLLLLILRDEPQWGKPIFQRLFSTQKTRFVLDFLDERTAVGQEALMFARLPIMPFLRALAKRSLGGFNATAFLPGLIWLLAVVMYFALTGFGAAALADKVMAGLLAVGLVVIGIPHGALDALTSVAFTGQSPRAFYAQYLSVLVLTLLGWWMLPNLTLLAFLLMSAWHFGQGDAHMWGKQPANGLGGVGWGALVLALMLGLHLPEVSAILLPLQIHGSTLAWLTDQSDAIATGLWAAWGIALVVLMARKNWAGLLSALTLAAAAQMPLLLGFGTYFVFHHSVSGWTHLRRGTNLSHQQLYRRGLPFTLAAFAFMAGGMYALVEARDASVAIGAFFAALSALSLPHIISSHQFLQSSSAAEASV